MVAGREPDRIRLQPGKSELPDLYHASGWQRCATRGRYGRTRHRPQVGTRWKDDLFHDMRQVRVQRRLSDLRGKARRIFGALAAKRLEGHESIAGKQVPCFDPAVAGFA